MINDLDGQQVKQVDAHTQTLPVSGSLTSKSQN